MEWVDVVRDDMKQCPNCKRFIKTSGQFDLNRCPNCGVEVKKGDRKWKPSLRETLEKPRH